MARKFNFIILIGVLMFVFITFVSLCALVSVSVYEEVEMGCAGI